MYGGKISLFLRRQNAAIKYLLLLLLTCCELRIAPCLRTLTAAPNNNFFQARIFSFSFPFLARRRLLRDWDERKRKRSRAEYLKFIPLRVRGGGGGGGGVAWMGGNSSAHTTLAFTRGRGEEIHGGDIALWQAEKQAFVAGYYSFRNNQNWPFCPSFLTYTVSPNSEIER